VQNRSALTPGENFLQMNAYACMYTLYHEHLHISKVLLKIVCAVSVKDVVWAEELPATAQKLLQFTAEMLLPRQE